MKSATLKIEFVKNESFMPPPLWEKLRPKTFTDVAGQESLVGEKGWIQKIISTKQALSILLFGPPGCGKTTIAKLYAQSFDATFLQLSAVFTSITEIKKIITKSKETPLFSKQLILFIDEIHRFNKAQQDAFLPFIEDGTIVLIGATTENPSFSLNNALLSRLRVLTLNSLSNDALEKIFQQYEQKIKKILLTKEAKKFIIQQAKGDGRHLLNVLENIQEFTDETPLDVESVSKILLKKPALYDRADDGHYQLISALHKSIRGSDIDASLYWLCRMLEGGEDPLFITRRLIRIATEDIGLADPEALKITIAAQSAYQTLGSPEGELALAQAVIYLALCPKSNALYLAYEKAKVLAEKTSHLPAPAHIVNAPTKLMKEMGFGKDYIYDHDAKNSFSGQNYFPHQLERASFYNPKEMGFEREMKKRKEYFSKLREKILQEDLSFASGNNKD